MRFEPVDAPTPTARIISTGFCCAVLLAVSMLGRAQGFDASTMAQAWAPTASSYWHPRALVDGLSEAGTFDPVQVLRDGGGYVLVDRDRRVYADANLTPLRQARNHLPVSSWQRIALLPNDAMVSLNQPPDPYCDLYAGTAHGEQTWSAHFIEAGCEAASFDRFGTLFATDYFGTRAVAADGRAVLLDPTSGDAFPGDWTHAAPAGGAYVYIDHGEEPSQISAYGPTLDLRWRKSLQSLPRHGNYAHWASAPGHLVLVAGNSETLTALRIDPETGDAAAIPASQGNLGSYLVAIAMDDDGRVTALAGDAAGNLRLQRFDTDDTVQTLRSGRDLDCAYFQFTMYGCALTSVGEHTYWVEHDDDGRARLYRVTGNGEPQLAWQSQQPVGNIAFGADGSIVVITGDATGRYSSFDHAPNRQIIRIGTAPTGGITTHSPLALAGGVEPVYAQYLHLEGGDVLEVAQGHVDYSLLATSRLRPWSIRRIDADGQVLWQRSYTDDGYYFEFGTSATQVCARVHGTVAEPNDAGGRLRCLAVADGALVMDRTIEGTIVPNLPTIVTGTPGKLFLNQRANAAGSTPELAKLMLLEGDTPSREMVVTDLDATHGLGADGRLALAYGAEGAKQLLLVDASGNPGAAQALPTSIQRVHSLAFGAEGDLWMNFAHHNEAGPRIARIGNDAQFIDAFHPAVMGTRVEQVVATPHGRLIRMGTRGMDFSGDPAPTSALLVSDEGALRWQHAASAQERIDAMVLAGERLQLLVRSNTTAYLDELDLASGLTIRRIDLPLPTTRDRYGSSVFPTVALDALDHVSTVHRKPGRVVLGDAGIAAPMDLTSLGPALTGAWQLDDLGGQGLVLDYHAASRTLSAAWFTHDGQPYPRHENLRWNTLVGNVASPTTSVPMTIHENHGGAFDAEPVTTSVVVGSATLTVSSCDHATLRYAFSDARVPPRTVALTRASPRTQTCATQDGIVMPATYTPRSDLGGAWFEPRTSGQGLHIAIYPPGSAGATETVGLGWFTYDPAGAADESTQQHWFTASGSFDDASEQRAALTLYRTTGGDRDTTATQNTHRVGEATLERIDCDSATLSYRFDDTLIANSFALRTRAIPLQRLGGCRP
ncbi:MAG: hypothetical protein HYV17_03995 [Xanthomonadales bacterium]|nr:hypothetical protein [Xanthomonadales bacterium]